MGKSQGNMVLAFAAIMGAAVIIDYGAKALRGAFAGVGGTAIATSGAIGAGQLPAGYKGGVMSPPQIAQLAKSVGFAGKDLQIAVAVALAESGGDPQNKSYNPDSVDRGLFQINSKYNSATSDQCAYDPVCNARDALKYKNERGWSDWTTYTTGRYLQYMGTAAQAVAAIGGG